MVLTYEKLCFEVIDSTLSLILNNDEYKWMMNASDEELAKRLGMANSKDAEIIRSEYWHRRSQFQNFTIEDLLSVAEQYLNGFRKTMVDCGCPEENYMIDIDLEELVNELRYRGIRVIGLESQSGEVVGPNPEGRIPSEMPGLLEGIVNPSIFELRSVKGTFIYSDQGESHPVRNASVSFIWTGSHPDKNKFINNKHTEQNGYFSDAVPDGLVVSTLSIGVSYTDVVEKRFSFTVEELRDMRGDLGTMVLSIEFSKGDSMLGALDNIATSIDNAVDGESLADHPELSFGGGDGDFLLKLGTASSQYSYSVLYRLIEPEMTRKDADIMYDPPIRKAIMEPIDISEFRKSIMKDPSLQLRMGSLGLGYIITLQQVWKPVNFALGNLLYSVALAPGEEQRLIIREKSESYMVSDREMLSSTLTESFLSRQRSSMDSMFNRSLMETLTGHSESRSKTVGTTAGSLAALFGAGSYSKTEASSSSYQNGSRDQISEFTENLNESLSRNAQSQRESSRIGIRMAHSQESTSVTSKIIANHNRSHALTMQYWEMIRNYSISTRVADVRLVCYIPLEIITFLPDSEDQSHIINSEDLVKVIDNRTVKSFFLERYEKALKYYDVLYANIPSEYRTGLRLMNHYATCPGWDFQNRVDNTPTKLKLTLLGQFLSYQDISVRLRLKNGKGWVKGHLKTAIGVDVTEASTKEEFIVKMRNKRVSPSTRLYELSVPPGVRDDDFDWLELGLKCPDVIWFSSPRTAANLQDKLYEQSISREGRPELMRMGTGSDYTSGFYTYKGGSAFISRAEYVKIGNPIVKSLMLEVDTIISTEKKAYLDLKISSELISTLTFNICDDMPTMTFEELQKIEMAFQHIVENTVPYSRAIWAGLTIEERAMLFEEHTVSVPRADPKDIWSQIPLANCISNQVEGFYGNCMVVPFHYSPAMAEEMETSQKEVQDALFRYHTEAFRAPDIRISIPVGGIVGEAVLGGSNASEKIDITRFWNWQDSPLDHAPGIGLSDLNTSLLSGAVAPSTLASLQQALSLTSPVTALPDITTQMTQEGAEFLDIRNAEGLSAHFTAAAKAASSERTNAVDQSAVLEKKACDVISSVMSGGASGADGGGNAANVAGAIKGATGSTGGGGGNASNNAAGTAGGGNPRAQQASNSQGGDQ